MRLVRQTAAADPVPAVRFRTEDLVRAILAADGFIGASSGLERATVVVRRPYAGTKGAS